jgi:hypothetical protein
MWPGTWRNPSLPTGCCGWCARCWTRTSGGACAHQSTCVVGPNLLAFGCLVWYYASSAERWPSGRRRSPAKRLQGLYLCRGFESRPLRHGASARRRTEDRDGRGVAPQGAPVAQWIERLPPEQEVGRSNRPGRTKQKLCDREQKTGQRRPPPGSARLLEKCALVAQGIERLPAEQEVGRSNRPERANTLLLMIRFSPARRPWRSGKRIFCLSAGVALAVAAPNMAPGRETIAPPHPSRSWGCAPVAQLDRAATS